MNKIDTEKLKETEVKPEDLHDFYDVSCSGSGNVTIKFSKMGICERLRKLGFFRYDLTDGGDYEYVRAQDGRIRVVSITKIKDVFEDFLLSLPMLEKKYQHKDSETGVMEIGTTKITGKRLQSKFYDTMDTYFGSVLDRLRPSSAIELMKDGPDYKYLFYNNCVVKVTKDGVEKMSYSAADGCVWEGNILDRDYAENTIKGDFERFVEHICGEDQERIKSLMSMLGYLMHDYYEVNLRAVLLTDVNKDDAQALKAAGGTGKGILGKALAAMINRTKDDVRYRAVPGKDFDAKDDKRYQLADISTQLIHVEDLNERFDIKDLYNDITDGATFRKMYGSPTTHFVKIMLSVNHTIRIDSSSDKRRLYIFELANYYNEKFTPVDEFGRMFFGRDWTDDDWHMFDTFMIRCVQRYLRYGVSQAEVINYGKRRIFEVFKNREDHLYFIRTAVEACLRSTDKKLFRAKMWSDFAGTYKQYDNRKDQIAFTKYLKIYFNLAEIAYKEVRGNNGDYYLLQPIEGKQIELPLDRPELEAESDTDGDKDELEF